MPPSLIFTPFAIRHTRNEPAPRRVWRHEGDACLEAAQFSIQFNADQQIM